MADVVIKVNQQVSCTAIAVMDDGSRELLSGADPGATSAASNDNVGVAVIDNPTALVFNEVAVAAGLATLTFTATLTGGTTMTVTKIVEVDALAATIASLDIDFGKPTLK